MHAIKALGLGKCPVHVDGPPTCWVVVVHHSEIPVFTLSICVYQYIHHLGASINRSEGAYAEPEQSGGGAEESPTRLLILRSSRE